MFCALNIAQSPVFWVRHPFLCCWCCRLADLACTLSGRWCISCFRMSLIKSCFIVSLENSSAINKFFFERVYPLYFCFFFNFLFSNLVSLPCIWVLMQYSSEKKEFWCNILFHRVLYIFTKDRIVLNLKWDTRPRFLYLIQGFELEREIQFPTSFWCPMDLTNPPLSHEEKEEK